MSSRITVTHKTEAQLASGGVDLTPTAFGKQWQQNISDVGTAQLQLANNDPNLAAIVANWEAELTQFIRFDLDSNPMFLMLVERVDTVALAPSEEVDQVTTIVGRGALAQWESAVVLPPNGISGQPYTETRVFDWGAAELNISAWGTPALLAQVGQGSEGEPPPEFPLIWLQYPLGWSDPTGYWIWSEPAGAGPAMPAGTSYFARDVGISTSGYYAVYAAADNRYTLKIDGVLIDEFDEEGSQEGYQFTRRADIYLTAGTHRIAAKVTNDASDGLAGFLFALWSVDTERNDVSLILRQDDTWKTVGYPAVAPGFTAGQVIRILLEEAQANGVLTGWTLSFTDTVDSEGNPWPTNQQWSFRVGMDLLSVLKQMGSGDIDFIGDPASLTLHAYNIDSMGVASGDATATLDRLSNLEFQGRT